MTVPPKPDRTDGPSLFQYLFFAHVNGTPAYGTLTETELLRALSASQDIVRAEMDSKSAVTTFNTRTADSVATVRRRIIANLDVLQKERSSAELPSIAPDEKRSAYYNDRPNEGPMARLPRSPIAPTSPSSGAIEYPKPRTAIF